MNAFRRFHLREAQREKETIGWLVSNIYTFSYPTFVHLSAGTFMVPIFFSGAENYIQFNGNLEKFALYLVPIQHNNKKNIGTAALVLFQTNLESNLMQHQSIKKALYLGQIMCRFNVHFSWVCISSTSHSGSQLFSHSLKLAFDNYLYCISSFFVKDFQVLLFLKSCLPNIFLVLNISFQKNIP